jgi:hypothetical protein
MDIFRNLDELTDFLMRKPVSVEQEAEELANQVALWVNDQFLLDSRRTNERKDKDCDA